MNKKLEKMNVIVILLFVLSIIVFIVGLGLAITNEELIAHNPKKIEIKLNSIVIENDPDSNYGDIIYSFEVKNNTKSNGLRSIIAEVEYFEGKNSIAKYNVTLNSGKGISKGESEKFTVTEEPSRYGQLSDSFLAIYNADKSKITISYKITGANFDDYYYQE